MSGDAGVQIVSRAYERSHHLALAQQSILSSPAFLEYLNYLQYLRAPEYAKFIHYPQCLHHLELCTKSETFREAIQHDATVGELAKTQVEHWRTWRELPVVDDKATEGKTEQMEEHAAEIKQAGQA